MVTLLLTSVLLLGFVAIAAYFYQRVANRSEPTDLPLPPPPPSMGLFSDAGVNQLRVPVEEPRVEPKVDNKTFEEAVQAIRDFQQTPNKNTATKLLHIAALTDDAKNYGRAVELLVMSWRDGSLAGFTAGQLQALINSEYWVLSSPARSSGAGFVLKRTLATANRELEPNN
jgi:hypothetical protein